MSNLISYFFEYSHFDDNTLFLFFFRKIIPQIIIGNLNAIAIMIGDKIADRIRVQRTLPKSLTAYFVSNGER